MSKRCLEKYTKEARAAAINLHAELLLRAKQSDDASQYDDMLIALGDVLEASEVMLHEMTGTRKPQKKNTI